jgi:hypothetical protein
MDRSSWVRLVPDGRHKNRHYARVTSWRDDTGQPCQDDLNRLARAALEV